MLRKLAGILAIVAVLGLIGGIGIVMGATESPLSDRIVASGYSTYDLSGAKCAKSDNGLPTCDSGDNIGNPWVVSYVYRPLSDRMCRYIFHKNGFGPLWTGGWEARIEWNPEENDGAFPLGSTGFKGEVDLSGPVRLTIDKPSPDELWAFVLEHLKDPNEKCKPVAT